LLCRGQRPPTDVPTHRYPSPIPHRSSDHNTWYSEPIFSHRPFTASVPALFARNTLPPPHLRCVSATSTSSLTTTPQPARVQPTRQRRRAIPRAQPDDPLSAPPPGHFHAEGLAAQGPPPPPPPPHRQVTSPSATLGRLRPAPPGRHLRTTLWAPLWVA
jgi:hypothetical protein